MSLAEQFKEYGEVSRKDVCRDGAPVVLVFVKRWLVITKDHEPASKSLSIKLAIPKSDSGVFPCRVVAPNRFGIVSNTKNKGVKPKPGVVVAIVVAERNIFSDNPVMVNYKKVIGTLGCVSHRIAVIPEPVGSERIDSFTPKPKQCLEYVTMKR